MSALALAPSSRPSIAVAFFLLLLLRPFFSCPAAGTLEARFLLFLDFDRLILSSRTPPFGLAERDRRDGPALSDIWKDKPATAKPYAAAMTQQPLYGGRI